MNSTDTAQQILDALSQADSVIKNPLKDGCRSRLIQAALDPIEDKEEFCLEFDDTEMLTVEDISQAEILPKGQFRVRNNTYQILRESAIEIAPPDSIKTTVISVKSNDDFWVILHQPGRAEVVEFRYGDKGDTADSLDIAEACAKYFGANTEKVELEPDFAFDSESAESLKFQLTSPSGKVYEEETEGLCLRALLAAEPDAILALGSQPA